MTVFGATGSNAIDNNSVYRTLLTGSAALSTSAASGTTYFFGGEASLTGGESSGATATSTLPLRGLFAADYAVSGLTTKLFLRASILTTSTAPAQTYTVGLYPVTINTSTITLGTVVSGSTVAFTTPNASAVTSGSSGDFTFPSDGPYAFGVIVSGTPLGAVTVSAALMFHNV